VKEMNRLPKDWKEQILKTKNEAKKHGCPTIAVIIPESWYKVLSQNFEACGIRKNINGYYGILGMNLGYNVQARKPRVCRHQ
jgi:hypothetical protein